eukprot:4804757-Pleurochrysis_carterae.AAC.1
MQFARDDALLCHFGARASARSTMRSTTTCCPSKAGFRNTASILRLKRRTQQQGRCVRLETAHCTGGRMRT